MFGKYKKPTPYKGIDSLCRVRSFIHEYFGNKHY